MDLPTHSAHARMAAKVLAVLADAPRPLRVEEVAATCGTDRLSTSAALQFLREHDQVRRVGRIKPFRYQLPAHTPGLALLPPPSACQRAQAPFGLHCQRRAA